MEFVTNAKQPTIGEYALKRGVLIYLSIYPTHLSPVCRNTSGRGRSHAGLPRPGMPLSFRVPRVPTCEAAFWKRNWAMSRRGRTRPTVQVS